MKTSAPLLTLCRIPIALVAACSAAAGSLAVGPAGGPALLPLCLGVFLLACGASALNQVQERDIDGLMDRTRHRPLPSGTLSARAALAAGITLAAAGLALIASAGPLPALLGAAGLVWYNGLYTPLKRRTAFAPLIGAPVGMVPVALGWQAAGGSLADGRMLALALFMLLWQVPHFWLLLLRSRDDYERAGLPSIATTLPADRIAPLVGLWTAAAGLAGLVLPLLGLVSHPLLGMLLAAASFTLAAVSLTTITRTRSWSAAFGAMNGFLLLLLAIIAADALVRMR